MKIVYAGLLALLVLSGCGGDGGTTDTTAGVETSLQPAVTDTALKPPAPPAL